MFRKDVAAGPTLIWLLCAITAPMVQLLAGADWKSVTLLSLACTGLTCLVLQCDNKWGKVTAIVELLWFAAAITACAGFASKSWPMGKTEILVPMTLLVLAAWSAQMGTAVAARMAGILFVLMSIGYGLILSSGVSQSRWQWVEAREPASWEITLYVMLLPAAAVCIPRERTGKRNWMLFGIPVFSALVGIATGGNVHPATENESYAFYEMSRSLSLFGLAERLEVLVCGLITVGWFALLSFLFCCVGSQIQMVWPGKSKIGIWIASLLAGAAVLGNLHIDNGILGIGAVIFWGLIPLVAQGVERVKNWRKK